MKPQRQSSKTKQMLEEEPEQGTRISNGPNTYQIGSEIGRGGFAVVFQAFNVQTGDFVAIKRFPLKAIDDESLSNIESEIELMQKLNHPNIVKYYDTIRTKDNLHIVLEYMENGSLSNVIKKFGSFSESLTAIYITQVLRGLKYLHEQGVLHRDIKGANILTTKDGMVKLADFGVAIKLSEAHENDQNVVGSPYWIAPEIIEMSAPTSACDIWSVGCIIIELLTKKPPYYDLPPMAALFRIVQDDYPPLPEGISQALRDFLQLCFQKEPAMRASAVKLLEHPWLHNSSTNSNLAQTSKMLESKAASSTSASEEQSNADSIVNTIRNHQLEATHHPISLHSQSVDPAALARKNLIRKSSGIGGNGLHPRTPTKKLAAESLDFVKTGGGHAIGVPRSDSKPPLKLKLARNATLNAKPSMPLLDSDVIRKVASLDSPGVKEGRRIVPPLIPSSIDPKSSPEKMRMSPSPASQSKSPYDDSRLRSRSGSGSVLSDASKDIMSRKDSFLLSDISDNTQGGVQSTDNNDDSGKEHTIDNNNMYAAGMQKFNDSSDEDWDSELREDGIIPASVDSIEKLLDIPRQKSLTKVDSLTKAFSTGTPKSTPKGTPKAVKPSPRHQHIPVLDTRSLSTILNAPIVEEEADSHLHRTHATVTAEALESVDKFPDDYHPRKQMSRNPALINQVSSGSTLFNLPNASSLSNEKDKSPSFVLNQSSQLSFLAKYKEQPDDENYDDLLRKSTSEEAHAYAETFVEGDGDSINDDDFDDGDEAIESLKIRRSSVNSSLSSVVGRSLMRSKSLPVAGTSSRSIEKFSASHDDFDAFDDDEDDGFSLSDARATINPFDMAGTLRLRMQQNVQEVVEEESDEFLNYQFDEKDFRQNEHKDVHFRRSREVVDIMGKIRPETEENDVIQYCTQLMTIFTSFPEQRDHLVTYHGVMPIIDMIEARSYNDSKHDSSGLNSSSRRRKTLRPFVLRVINKIIEGSTRAQEQLSLVGIIPTVMNIFDRSHRSDYSQIMTPAYHHYAAETPLKRSNAAYLNAINAPYHKEWHQQVDPVTLEAARFIHQISSTSSLTLQMLIGAGGLSVLTNMVSFGAHIIPLGGVPITASSPKHRFPEGGNFQSPPSEGKKKTSFLTYSDDKLDSISGDTSALVLNQLSTSLDTLDSTFMRQTSNESLLGSNLLNNETTDDSAASMQIFQMGIDCIAHVFAVQSSRTRDFCRLFVKLGLLPHLSVAFQNILSLYLSRLNGGSGVPGLPGNNSGTNLSSSASGSNDGVLVSPRRNSLTIPRLSDLGIASPTNASRSNSGTIASEAAASLARPNLNNIDAPSANSQSKPTLSNHVKHHRKNSSSTDSGAVLGQESIDDCAERKYTQEIATLFFKFSRSDSVVAEMMSNNDYGVVTVILTALRAPELRFYDVSIGGHSQAGSHHSLNSLKDPLDSSNHGQNSSSRPPSTGHNSLISNFPQLNLAPLQITPHEPTVKRRSINLSNVCTLHPTYVEIVELLLKCLKNLSMEPSTLTDLEKAGAVEVLIPLLSGPISDKCRNHILPTIFNMCRINKKRQEHAAQLGLIPHLKKVISDGSPMRQFALPVLFDLAHTSTAARTELWKNDCVGFYLDQLKENYWQTFALNSLAIWLSYDTVNVGKLLIEPSHLNKLVEFFRASSVQTIQTLHKPLHDMMLKSKELARALSSSTVYVTALIKILKTTCEAIVLRSLLKMLQLLHHYHPNPFQFVAEYELIDLVKDFAQSESQVLVSQIAEKLLLDFQLTSSIASSSTDSSLTFY